MARRGLRDVARHALEEYAGLTIQPTEAIERMQSQLVEAVDDVGTLRRELNRMGYESFDYQGQRPTELTPKARMTIVHKAQVAWSEDPQAGAAIDLRNAFVFGRGVPTPQAHDDEVQTVIDETWDDPANKRILTSHAKLVEKGIDLGLQSNLFLLFYEDGMDGMVRLGLAEHDTIVKGIRHPDDRMRILYYKAVRHRMKWDWSKGDYVLDRSQPPEVGYYQALDAFLDSTEADEDEEGDGGLGTPPQGQLLDGLLLHVAVNKRSEAIFGIPRMKRLLRWFNAYEQLMRTSVDLMKAAASIYMKATTARGGAQQLERASYQHTRRASPLTELAVSEYAGSGQIPNPPPAGPSVLYQNPAINYEPFSIDPHADDTAALASQTRMQISAGTNLPPHYTGDSSNGNLALATAIELPVLAIIHEEQEVWEQVFRTLADRAIARRIKLGLLSEWRDATEEEIEQIQAGLFEGDYDEEAGLVKRDLGYTFSLPDPLKRVLSDLVQSVVAISKQWDPMNTNRNLQRFMFGLLLEQGFDIEDPRNIIDQVFPKRDDEEQRQAEVQAAALELARASTGFEPERAPAGPANAAPGQTQAPTSTGADGRQHPASNPYGAPLRSTPPEQIRESGWRMSDRDFREVLLESAVRAHRGMRPRPEDPVFHRAREQFEQETLENMRELLRAAHSNGNGNGDGAGGGDSG